MSAGTSFPLANRHLIAHATAHRTARTLPTSTNSDPTQNPPMWAPTLTPDGMSGVFEYRPTRFIPM